MAILDSRGGSARYGRCRKRRTAGLRSHCLDVRYKLVEGFAPPVVEAHLLVLLSSRLIPMDCQGGVARSIASRFQSHDGSEKRVLRGAVPGEERVGPDQSLIRNDFQVAANAGELLSFRRPHDGSEDAARAQIDLTVHDGPGRWREPFADVLGLRPGSPDQVPRYVDHTLENQVELGIGFQHRGRRHLRFSLRSMRYPSS